MIRISKGKIKTKKAQLVKTFVRVAMVLIVLVLLLIFAIKLQASINKKSDREVCRASVIAQSIAMFAPGGEKLVSPDCSTHNIVFYNNRVEIDGKQEPVYDSRRENTVPKFNGLTEEIVSQVIAEELRWCWYQFVEGKRSLFSMNNIFASGKRTCFICDEISFDSSVQQKEFKGFYEYTKTKAIPGLDMTYYEYYALGPRICSSGYKADYDESNLYVDESMCWERYLRNNVTFIPPSITERMLNPIKKITYPIMLVKEALQKSVYSNRPTMQADLTFDVAPGNKYVVFFVREGEISRAEKALKDDETLFETYFAYVIPEEALSQQCNYVKRGSAK